MKHLSLDAFWAARCPACGGACLTYETLGTKQWVGFAFFKCRTCQSRVHSLVLKEYLLELEDQKLFDR